MDNKLQGAEILRPTGCQVGRHNFTWTASGPSLPPPYQRCNCQAYTWAEWATQDKEKADAWIALQETLEIEKTDTRLCPECGAYTPSHRYRCPKVYPTHEQS